MGTTLMWAEGLHLVFGNAIIGAIEGGIICAWARPRRKWPIVLAAIIANYFSMIAGTFVVEDAFDRVIAAFEPTPPVVAARFALPLVAALTLLASLIAEAPIVAVGVWLGRARKRSAAIAFLVANAVTYTLLVIFYLGAGSYSALAVPFDGSLSFVPKDLDVVVYYIGPEGDLRRIRIDGTGDAAMADIHPPADRALFAWPESDTTFTLYAQGTYTDPWPVLLSVPGTAPIPRRPHSDDIVTNEIHEFGSPGLVGPAWMHDLRGPNDRELSLLWNYRSLAGLVAWRGKELHPFTFDFASPVAKWWPHNVTALRGSLFIFEMPPDQIILADVDRNVIGLLARGSSPVAVASDVLPTSVRDPDWPWMPLFPTP